MEVGELRDQWSKNKKKLESSAMNHGFENIDLENLTCMSLFNSKFTKIFKS